MIYKRGNTFWAKFQRNKKEIRKSLQTDNYEIAVEREATLKKQAELSETLLVEDASLPRPTLTELQYLTRVIYAGVKHRSKRKNIPNTLTQEQILLMLTEANGKCAVTGIPLNITAKLPGKRVSPWMPSIDRIDPSKGYTASNCRIVCYLANIAMSQFGESALELMLQYYAKTKFKR